MPSEEYLTRTQDTKTEGYMINASKTIGVTSDGTFEDEDPAFIFQTRYAEYYFIYFDLRCHERVSYFPPAIPVNSGYHWCYQTMKLVNRNCFPLARVCTSISYRPSLFERQYNDPPSCCNKKQLSIRTTPVTFCPFTRKFDLFAFSIESGLSSGEPLHSKEHAVAQTMIIPDTKLSPYALISRSFGITTLW